MAQSNLRERALVMQRIFEDALFVQSTNQDETYLKISTALKFIKDVVEPFIANQESHDKMVFIIGPSGVGKSTLMNYIAGKALFYRLHNDRPGIFPQAGDSIAYVGRGEGSTTLAPNIWRSNLPCFQGVTFVDFAGDLDSLTLVEVINSKIRAIVAQNARYAKVLLVTSQDSLGPSGSYGAIFKEGFEKSAQFLTNVHYFEDSIALIVSHAGRVSTTEATVASYLNSVIRNPQIERYKPTLEHLLRNNCMTTFSKYSDEIEEGMIYDPPRWNVDQRDQIIALINKVAFKPIPSGLFSNSSSVQVREQMGRAFGILKSKAIVVLQRSIENLMQQRFIIRATNLRNFVRFLEDGIIYSRTRTDLASYVQHLNKEKFFNITCSDEIQKLHEELEFVAPFTISSRTEEDWSSLIGINALFRELLDEAKTILHGPEEIFCSYVHGNRVATIGCFGQDSGRLKELFANLDDAYKKKASIESQRNDEKYQVDRTESQFKGMKKEFYQEPYTERDSYQERLPYTEVEEYTEERFVRRGGLPADDFCTYVGGIKPFCFRNLEPHEYAKYPWWEGGDLVGTFQGRASNLSKYCDARVKWYQGKGLDPEWTHVTFNHQLLCYDLYSKDRKTRNIWKERVETKSIDVIKYRTAERSVPEYEAVQVKKFDAIKYERCLDEATAAIGRFETSIKDVLHRMKETNAKEKRKLPLNIVDAIVEAARNSLCNPTTSDGAQNQFSRLKEEWKHQEYEAQMIFDQLEKLAQI